MNYLICGGNIYVPVSVVSFQEGLHAYQYPLGSFITLTSTPTDDVVLLWNDTRGN